MNDERLNRVWSEREATRTKAQREANVAAGPCPNCGAEADVQLVDCSAPDRPVWLPGSAECSARCYEADPDAYLAAVRSQKDVG